jgi:hypothetical protein
LRDKDGKVAEQNDDRFGTAEGGRKLAIDIALRVLIEHASASDPRLRDRLMGLVDAYIAQLEPRSELEDDFATRAKANMAALLQPPDF